MKKIKPVITEKSLLEAKNGKYTFLVPVESTKHTIKDLINKFFDVTVTNVWTSNQKGGIRRNAYRRKIKVSSTKKAVVTLADKQTIHLFGEEK